MLSPVKVIAAGALLFALGGAMLVAQPLGQQGQGEPAAQRMQLPGVTVTATQDCGPVYTVPITCSYTASDSRVTGTPTHEWIADISGPSSGDVTVGWAPATLEGPEGNWTGHYYTVWGDTAHVFSVLSGTGAYEGWHYVASSIDPEADGDADVVGVMYEGDPPPFGPLPPATSE